LVNDGVTVFEVFMRSLYHESTTLSSPLTKKIHKKTPTLSGGGSRWRWDHHSCGGIPPSRPCAAARFIAA
jgi:hypothetical protein